MTTGWRICPPVNRQYGHDFGGVQAPAEPREFTANVIPGRVWSGRARNLEVPGSSLRDAPERPLQLDPLAAVGAEQMQFFARHDGADALADGGRDRAGNPHDDVARRQFAGIGGDVLRTVLSGAVDEGFGADVLDRPDGEIERNTPGDAVAGNDKILGRIPSRPASPVPPSCDLISSERSGSRFIGGAPMKDATKVVAGF